MKDKKLNLSGDFVPSLHLAPYISKKQSVTIIKLYISIPDGFAYKKDI